MSDLLQTATRPRDELEPESIPQAIVLPDTNRVSSSPVSRTLSALLVPFTGGSAAQPVGGQNPGASQPQTGLLEAVSKVIWGDPAIAPEAQSGFFSRVVAALREALSQLFPESFAAEEAPQQNQTPQVFLPVASEVTTSPVPIFLDDRRPLTSNLLRNQALDEYDSLIQAYESRRPHNRVEERAEELVRQASTLAPNFLDRAQIAELRQVHVHSPEMAELQRIRARIEEEKM